MAGARLVLNPGGARKRGKNFEGEPEARAAAGAPDSEATRTGDYHAIWPAREILVPGSLSSTLRRRQRLPVGASGRGHLVESALSTGPAIPARGQFPADSKIFSEATTGT